MPENEVWTTFKAKTHKLASCSSCLLACLGIRVSSFSSQRRTTHVTWPNTRRLKRCACMPSAPQKGLISELRLQNVSSSSSSKSWSSSWFSPLAFFKMIEKMWKHFSLSLYVTHNVTSLSFLDRHHAWRSLDPTLAISSTFVKKKKSIQPPFFLLLHLFFI